ncbi:MAG TPA: signal peptidase II [Candidatus Limiplasma sp.]|nr:signal peptidase II [Candidatus Limiplasma sp.]
MTVFWSIAGVTLVLDRVAKLLAQQLMSPGERMIVLRGVLELRFTYNTGMALGILSGHLVAGILLPLLAMAAGVFILRKFKLSRFVLIGVGLIVGGFLGNFADRILFGSVVDMIYFPWLPYFICNPADIAITFGAAMLGFSLLFRAGDWQEKAKEAADDK